jgi:anti-sigma regulatory factor (Ser/Thr protein kinase)
MEEIAINVSLRNQIDEIRRIHQLVEDLAGRLRLSGDVSLALMLSLEEVLTNVIQYGYQDSDEHQIEVRIVTLGDSIHLEVEDDGRPFNPLDVPEPATDLPLEERPLGGLGVFLVRKLMDSVQYRRRQGHNLLHMEKSVAEKS